MSGDFLKQMYGLSKKRASRLPLQTDFSLPVRSLKAALTDMAVIAEVKYATPKDGLLGIAIDPAGLAQLYERLGARAISCLTEPSFFGGSLEHLGIIRSSCRIPILMKDFITDARQIASGRSLGADACLLIAEMLSLEELAELSVCGDELGMDCLVEVHSHEGLEKAASVGASLIGVNARNLRTLKVDSAMHGELAGYIPQGVVKVAESGITSGRRLRELRDMGYDAALIGRALADTSLREEIFRVGKDLRHHPV
jgi:indole-3-glycerol phosphate synthase